jgi:hypothetical protein
MVMGLFGFGSKKDKAPARSPDAVVSGAVYELACAFLNKPPQGIHVEDLISALAAVTAEFCIRAQGEVDVDSHGYGPGSPVLSDGMNRRLSGDAQTWDQVPQDTILGLLYRASLAAGYAPEDFPPLEEVYKTYVAGIGKGDIEWGRVALSVTDAPFMKPLQAAYELRDPVRNIFATHGVGAPGEQAIICAAALAQALRAVKQAIKPSIAATIAVETVNGMAKTAPMTDARMKELEAQAKA